MASPVEIIPAILPYSYKELETRLGALRGVSRKVQIDIYEGGFFGWGKTWPLRDRRSFEKMQKDETGLPFWTEFDFEFDLMVSNPKDLALQLINLHAGRLIVHASFPGALEAAQVLAEYEDTEHPLPPELGIAIGAHAKPEDLDQFEGMYDFVQVMGIAQVGAQGRHFDKRALRLVQALRQKFPNMNLQVDGGVAPHVRELAQAGAGRLIVGSAIMRAKDPKAVLEKLYNEANGVQ